MRLPQLAGCVIIGILPLLWLPDLPERSVTRGLMLLALLIAQCRRRAAHYAALITLFFVWGVLSARQALWPTHTLTNGNRQVEVMLTATDGQTTHQGRIVRLDGRRLFPAPGVSLYGNYLPEPPCAGQVWAMTLRARPVHSQLNEGGFDSQRYALSQHRPLTGRFISAEVRERNCSVRARYLASLNQTLAELPWQSVMLGLGMGERLAIPREIKILMQETGTSHLMAISGLHIALGATLGWLLLRGLQFFLPCRWLGWRAPLLTGLASAIFYAWLTGMQPPALRTCVALIVGCALRLSGKRWSPWQLWLCCIGAILFADPLAALSESLWLSAFAVAALIFWYQLAPMPGGKRCWLLRQSLALCHLQIGLMFLLAPLQIALFHGISLTSVLANLIAVPLVTFIVVPLILTAMFLHLCAPLTIEMVIWQSADRILAALFGFLRQLPPGWLELDARWLGISLLPWPALILWRFHAWRTLPAFCLACLGLLSWPFWRSTATNEWRVTMLDVGQGLAMVIERHGAALLYDTGLAWPEGDSGEQIIIPWLRWHHLHLEGVVLSHEHLDHRGGLNSVLKAWPQIWIRSPLGWAGHLACQRGEIWLWRGLTFRAFWPLPGATKQGNNRSCVVRVDDGKHSILLTGDIETPAEQAMISHYWQHLASTLIQVPHHGSNTSSGTALLRSVGGEAALASASRYNAWRMPSTKVKQRYRNQNYQWFDTPHQGQVTVIFSADGWQIHSLRDQVLPRWYHQWFGGNVQNG
ncbi:TPA: ComEC family protein [Klebsiella oxytoca]|uniref:ComEC family protein n=1 Tax=Klebsiella oxytoca TaxID=571 RepID=UPI001A34058A|nr:ComEC family protein [Klebsiella oxytoca]MDS7774471.1 ComEC family protein [Klebsiella oxytoca]MEC5294765.1 ComEC family protein [Klebsiella oxytoca]MEC5333505.1 ComEC family protein [Klebsiella oxytoca]MEC5367272.1 ComEC family protein [Klebsiella oxytoca]CAH5669398.1 ComE operon protein 3 [Klebsiella oxytoca]